MHQYLQHANLEPRYAKNMVTKKDLIFKEYIWTTKYIKNALVPAPFDRASGHDVLQVINSFIAFYLPDATCEDVNKLEKLLVYYLPSYLKRVDETVYWIAKNWKLARNANIFIH